MRKLIIISLLIFGSCPLFADNLIFGLSEVDKYHSSLSAGSFDMSFSNAKFDFDASYCNWTTGLTFYNAGVGVKLNKLAFNLNGSYLPGLSYALNSNKNYTPLDLYLGLSASYLINNQLSINVKAKYYTSKLTPNDSYTGIGFGLGAAYQLNDVILGLGVQNIGPKVKSKSGIDFILPSAAVLNAMYKHSLDIIGLKANLEAKYYFNGALAANIGLCGDYKDLVFIKLGYNYGSNLAPLPSYALLGAGVKFFGVNLDFTYLLASKTLSNSMIISLGYSF